MTATSLDHARGAAAGEDSRRAGDARETNTPSVTKALHLLDSFRGADVPLGVSAIARRSGIPKSTTHRLIAYLERSGYVERQGRGYVLGRLLFELGNSVLMCRPSGLREVATPHLARLFAEQGQVVHLGVLDGAEVVCLEKLFGLGSVRVPTIVGGRTPANCSSLGKAMLAFADRETLGRFFDTGLVRRTRYSRTTQGQLLAELRKVRAQHIAYDHEETQIGLVCTAAPIFERGRAIAAVSVSGLPTQCNLAAVGEAVRRTATAITRDLAVTGKLGVSA
ncbi:IclR family transcriptional regulator [Nocardia sp. NPDC050378]|uniref:IclR family transcriptional regulator n=1 Tax=Nocardia sp. NPDC050378 TaxID=3155400 RepID=UPI0033D41625